MAASAEVINAPNQPESATTLRTIVELVRRIMRSDTASIISFSLADKTITWRAASGFRTHLIDEDHPLVRPITDEIAQQPLTTDSMMILEGIGVRGELPGSEYPVHAAEGVRDLALAPLKAQGQTMGALIVGYRSPHDFSDDEKEMLQDLAEMAALALDNARLVETVSENESRLRLAHQAARIGTFEWNIQTGVNTWSPELEAMYGIASGSFANTQAGWEDLIHGDDRALAMASVQKAVETGAPIEEEWRVTWPDGSIHWLFARFQVFADASGEPLRLTGVNMDITERKAAEEVLQQSEARAQRGKRIWEQTFDAIGEGILVHDQQRRIVRCNARAAEMIDMQPAEVLGLSFSDALARLVGERAAAFHLAENTDGPSAFEVQTEDGRRHLVSMFPIRQPDGDSVSVVTLNDVTRLSEMQEQLGRTRRLASVGQLAAGVAHEINNPLAAITTCAEATMRDMRQTSEILALAETRQWNYYLEEIVRQSLRCKEITRGLLDLTRQRKARRTMCDVNSIAKQCAKVAVQRAGSATEFEINIDENIGEVATDAAMVRQILDNLFSNAIDALGDGKGKVGLSTNRDGDRISIEITDTGTGVSSELISRIFDPFFSTKGPGKGYGLGLAISLSLAESLGGALTVESKAGEGSRFRLWIPRRGPEE
ncbi:MAG TPA: ATP-binding protein [Pyrinomonadaceae bacterium]|nr:ATP-binding protein [Pyrinomonadaceae bacterium]